MEVRDENASARRRRGRADARRSRHGQRYISANTIDGPATHTSDGTRLWVTGPIGRTIREELQRRTADERKRYRWFAERLVERAPIIGSEAFEINIKSLRAEASASASDAWTRLLGISSTEAFQPTAERLRGSALRVHPVRPQPRVPGDGMVCG